MSLCKNNKFLCVFLNSINSKIHRLFNFSNDIVLSNSAYRENLEFKPDQTDWLKVTESKIHRLIEETPPNGKEFGEAVGQILKVNLRILCSDILMRISVCLFCGHTRICMSAV